MLELINIQKTYSAGVNEVRALRGIDLQFRKAEFVSILGPSGCGKTTMLNIIGGLDQYSDGDLIIDGVSTRNYGDREWDTYRNHSVGFVFQNYNLIPHQTVLANVEIALSLSGVEKKERRERAKRALEQVGLGDQLRKKPSEMSGGQMQRVAIARALVNNPDIILADEPTGALDTETSVQVMEILKEISKDRLVIMVTHNPELAEAYSTRIIRMLDGQITGDTMPLSDEELQTLHDSFKEGQKEKVRKPAMSLWTSFGLSLKNLFTKKGRTILTAFAGSIGIIGIALIYAVSQGTNAYIQDVQEDTLASYPLTLEASTVDIGTLMETFMGAAKDSYKEHPLDAVYSQSVMADMINAFNSIESTENDLNAFKAKVEKELENPDSELSKALSGVQYTYNFDLQVYTEAVDGQIILSDTEKLLMEVLAKNMPGMSSMMQMGQQMSGNMGMAMMGGGRMTLWNEMLSGKDGSMISPLLKQQYNIVKGEWPDSYDEIVVVVNERYELDDLTLYALGLKPRADMDAEFDAVLNGKEIDTTQQKWEFDEIMAMEFRVVPNSQCFIYDKQAGTYIDLREDESGNGLRALYNDGIPMKITAIVTPNPDSGSHMLSGSIGYTKALTEYIIKKAAESSAIQTQLKNPSIDVLTGLPFRAGEDVDNATKAEMFRAAVEAMTPAEKAEIAKKIAIMQGSEMTEEEQNAIRDQALAGATAEIMTQTMVGAIVEKTGWPQEQALEYVKKMSLEELQKGYGDIVVAMAAMKKAEAIKAEMEKIPEEQLVAQLDALMEAYDEAKWASYYDNTLEFSERTYDEVMHQLGNVDLEYPATMNLYASSFENKEVIESFIASYNDDVEELKQIRYTDYIGLILSGVTDIIDAITYVLISFVSISLVVSSIMIGVITLISVQERTKEIGILRAIGASKRNVSSMFNAETVIIGFASGLIGIGTTYLLCIPINAIIQALTGIDNLRAQLPLVVAIALVIISVLLTLIAGIIPSRSAAKKDPVVALRSE